MAAMVNNDLVSLVNTRPFKPWKETLALLCTFAQREDWTLLCDTLASRLLAAGNTLAATLCYICAGNIDRTVEIWSKNVTSQHEGKSYVDLLQDLMEKTVVLALATGQKRFSASLCKLVEKYAEILANRGLLTTAMEYLKLMGTEDISAELVILRDRIAFSSDSLMGTEDISANLSKFVQDDVAYSSQNYQQPPAYATQYQQQHPTTFVPAPAPNVPSAGFTPQPLVHPVPKVFVPSNLPIMKNADQFQQAPSLASQLYTSQVNASPNYQVGLPVAGSLGPVPSPMVPTPVQNVGPTPQVRGFMPMPVSNTGVAQRTSSGQMPSTSPTPPAAPPTAPPTVHTADVSNVLAHQRAVITTLTRLFTETSEIMGGSHAVPAKKREIDDNSKKLGALFVKPNSGDISKNASEKLVKLCQALDRGDFTTPLKIKVDLTTSDWDECSFWLATLKRMIKIKQTSR